MSELIDRLSTILTPEERAKLAGLPLPVQPVPPPVPAPVPTLKGIRKLASGLTHEYATMWPGDPLHRAIILQHPHGQLSLHYQDTGAKYADLPSVVNTGSQPRWRRTKPDCFLYLWLNELREFNAGTLTSTTIRKFSDRANINGMGESDLSEDDRHIVLCTGRDAFVYDYQADQIITSFTIPAPFDSLYLTSTNQPVIGFYAGGHALWTGTMFWPLAAALGHMDTSSDASGQPVMVWCNAADTTGVGKNAALANCKNGIVLINIATGVQKCLLSLDWSLAAHISLPDRAAFALVTTYDPKNSASVAPWANSIVKVPLDGSTPSVLVKHGSKIESGTTADEKYALQPKASVSPDGTRFVYDSNGDVFLGSVE